MIEDDKIVMLSSDLKGFYVCSINEWELKAISTLDFKTVELLELVDTYFEDVTKNFSNELSNLKFEEVITIIENQLAPKTLMGLSLKLDQTFVLHYHTGELSLHSEDVMEVQRAAIEILDASGYKGSEIFEKLTNYKQMYISVDQEGEFDLLYPHPSFDEEDEEDSE